jgi:hypothetical protein
VFISANPLCRCVGRHFALGSLVQNPETGLQTAAHSPHETTVYRQTKAVKVFSQSAFKYVFFPITYR